MRYVFFSLLTIAMIGLAQSASAQVPPSLYAAVLETRGYVVGAANAPSGLHRYREGESWTHLGWGNVRNFGVAAVPAHPDTLFLAAGNGVFHSRDGGASWRITTAWRITEVLDVAIDPNAPDSVYAATAYGVFRSPDLGRSWTEANSGIPAPQATYTPTIGVDRRRAGHLVVGSEEGLFRTTDGGAHWTPVGPRGVAICEVKQSPAVPRLWMAGAQDQSLLVSRDGGRTWNFVDGGPAERTVYAIAFDPSDPERIAAAGYETGVHISTDGGAHWRRARGFGEHNVHALAFDPETGGRLWAGTFGDGAYYTDDLDPSDGASSNDDAQWTFAGLKGAVIWEMDFIGNAK